MLNRLLHALRPTKQQPDKFIRRIRSLLIGEGMLREGNIELMEYAIQNLPPTGSVLEIGSYGGLSTNVLIHLLKKHKKTNPFFTCDAWIYEGYDDHLADSPNSFIDGREDLLRSDYSTYMKNAFLSATRFLSGQNLPHSFQLYSHVFFEKWKNNEDGVDIFGNSARLGGEISFAYLDGGHAYEVAWQDFQNIAQHLVVGGYVLLDDSADTDIFGSAKMMKEIKKDSRFRVVAKKPNYLVQKIQH